MDLIDDPAPGQNAPEFTVSEISGAVKRTLEGEFARVRVRGELGRVNTHRSGHVYLDLKDDRAVLSGVIWKGTAGRLATPPEEGMEVVATGRLTTFPGQSKYQIVIEDLRPAGVGALMAMLERRRAALQAEGLFDADRKRPLPYLPSVIGVVTSPTGAVIRDILHRLADRFPRQVIVWPVAVQGPQCAAQVAAAIDGFNALAPGGPVPRPDLLIVARGGGSIEDLWGFNEEVVLRAVARGTIPLISAVGHETDTTLIDHVSDHRAPTPTAAAERAVPVRAELLARLAETGARLARGATGLIARRRQRAADLARGLPRPEALLDRAHDRFEARASRLPFAIRHRLRDGRATFSDLSRRLPQPQALLTRASDRLERRAIRLRPLLLRDRLAAAHRRLDTRTDTLEALRQHAMDRRRDRLAGVAARLTTRPLRQRLSRAGERAAVLGDRHVRAVALRLTRNRARLDAADRLRETLGYQATLRRGYAVIRAGDTLVTTRAGATAAPPPLEIEFHDGRFVTGARPARPRRKPTPPGQGTLI